jgi:hypothetical protein
VEYPKLKFAPFRSAHHSKQRPAARPRCISSFRLHSPIKWCRYLQKCRNDRFACVLHQLREAAARPAARRGACHGSAGGYRAVPPGVPARRRPVPVDEGRAGILKALARVRSHCRFRNRGTEYVSESGVKRMNGSRKRQCERALASAHARLCGECAGATHQPYGFITRLQPKFENVCLRVFS